MNTRTQKSLALLALVSAGCLPKIEFTTSDAGDGAANVEDGAIDSAASVEDGASVDSGIDTGIDTGVDTGAVIDGGAPMDGDGPSDAGACARITQLVLGQRTSCVVRANGRLYCWGSVFSPTGGATGTSAPQRVPLTWGAPITSVSLSAASICTLHDDGVVRCWGSNTNGQAGGTPGTPQTERTLFTAGATMLGGSALHHCAVIGSSLACWGSRGDRRIQGTNCCGDAPTPQNWSLARESLPVRQMSFSHRSHAFVNGATALYVWGPNGYGLLGTNSTAEVSQPTLNMSFSATKVAMGAIHACILNSSNEVRCAGLDQTRAVNPTVESRGTFNSFVLPLPSERFHDVVVGDNSSSGTSNAFTCALAANDRTVRCWGDNTYGTLATSSPTVAGATNAYESVPPIRLLAAGERHVCVVDDLDRVFCWGDNAFNQTAGRTVAGRDSGTVVDVPKLVVVPCD